MVNKDRPKKPKYATVKKGGIEYVRIRRKVGRKRTHTGAYIADYKDFYGKTYKEAVQKYEAFIRKDTANGGRCLGELVEQWIEHVFSVDGKYKDRTKERYINAFHYAFKGSRLLGKEIDNIKGADLQAAYNNMDCGVSTIKACHKLLRLFFKYAERENLARDITKSLVLPQGKPASQEVDILSSAEIVAILDAFKGHRLEFLILLALRTGLRISELLALKYDDISSDGVRVNKQLSRVNGAEFKVISTKTKTSERLVPLSNEMIEALNRHKNWHSSEMLAKGYRTDNLFTTENGAYYHQSSIQKACNRVYKKAGVRSVGFHIYRHTFASNLASNGVPIQTVADLLGHSNINVTHKYYVNIAQDEKKAAIKAMTL